MGVRGRNRVDTVRIAGISGINFMVSNCHFILLLLDDGNSVSAVE